MIEMGQGSGCAGGGGDGGGCGESRSAWLGAIGESSQARPGQARLAQEQRV